MDVPNLSLKQYMLAYAVVLALLGVNIGLSFIPMGWVNMFIGITIATLQSCVIALFLMHGLFEKPVIRLVMGGALLWFMILMTLTMTDYITRNWLPVAGK